MILKDDPEGLGRVLLLASAILRVVGVEENRRHYMAVQIVFYGTLFLGIVTAETLFATLLFSMLSVEVLGTNISGAAFALMVPAVIGMVHVKLHSEGDHFTRWWLSKLSTIGIPLFCLGISLSLGFAAWQAAEDVVGVLSSGPRGALGDQVVSSEPPSGSGIAVWLSFIPNALLFLGLSFGMIISVALASHCLGRALVAFNVRTQMPRIGPWARETIAVLQTLIAEQQLDADEDKAARLAQPIDPKLKFAREASHACRAVSQRKLSAARRVFAVGRAPDAMATVFPDADAETIPTRFSTEATFKRHMTEVLDATRVHNLLAQIGGFSQED